MQMAIHDPEILTIVDQLLEVSKKSVKHKKEALNISWDLRIFSVFEYGEFLDVKDYTAYYELAERKLLIRHGLEVIENFQFLAKVRNN